LLDGWTLSSAAIFNSGNPFTPMISFNNSRSGVAGATATFVDRPNLKPSYGNNPVIGSPDQWYDPNAFELPAPGTFGNRGRNTVFGPGFTNLDFSLLKETRVTRVSESFRIQFRMEVFNALNHVNFGAWALLDLLPHRLVEIVAMRFEISVKDHDSLRNQSVFSRMPRAASFPMRTLATR
jgi:hypothetical protein